MGLNFIAGGMRKSDERLLSLMMQKMELADGYLLKRLFEEKMRLMPAESVIEKRRELVLKIVATLAKEGRIDGSWSGFLPEYEEPAEVASEPEFEVDSEETKTFSARHSPLA
jgi:hypothetical protein